MLKNSNSTKITIFKILILINGKREEEEKKYKNFFHINVLTTYFPTIQFELTSTVTEERKKCIRKTRFPIKAKVYIYHMVTKLLFLLYERAIRLSMKLFLKCHALESMHFKLLLHINLYYVTNR